MIDYDLFGHCCNCHKNMLIEQVVGGRVIKRFTPDFSEVEYLLNDASKMRVTICVQCQELGAHEDTQTIMDTVIKGWQHMVDGFVKDDSKPQWTQEFAEAHMEWYGNLEIVTLTEKHDEDSLKVKLAEHKNNISIHNLVKEEVADVSDEAVHV